MYWCVRVLELPKKNYFVDSYFAEKRIVAVWVIFQYSKLFIRHQIRVIESIRNKVDEVLLRSFIHSFTILVNEIKIILLYGCKLIRFKHKSNQLPLEQSHIIVQVSEK